MKELHKYRIVNKTRYDFNALEELVRFATMTANRARHPYPGRIVFAHSTPKKGAMFGNDPRLVKMDRHRKIEDGFVVGIVKPTRTGKPFVGLNELTVLAAMQSMTAPIDLRRQIIFRLISGMTDRNLFPGETYGDRSWCAKAPPLPFYDSDPTPERIKWEEERVDLLAQLRQKTFNLNYRRGEVEDNRKQEVRYRKRKEECQAQAAAALETLQAFQSKLDDFFRLGPPF